MYGHPALVKAHARIYQGKYFRLRKRFRRYQTVLMPRWMTGCFAAGAALGVFLRWLIS